MYYVATCLKKVHMLPTFDFTCKKMIRIKKTKRSVSVPKSKFSSKGLIEPLVARALVYEHSLSQNSPSKESQFQPTL